jgi:hypothetical protein
MTKTARTALLGACLTLPIAAYAGRALAAQPEGGHYVYVPAGATVLVLPGPGVAASAEAVPADFPVARMIAQQDAMMQRMFADMDSLMATPFRDPEQMIRSVMNGVPQAIAGSGVVMTSISGGNGVCGETITYDYPAGGGQPQVKVTRIGHGCGAITSSGPVGVTDSVPAQQHIVPQPVSPGHERLWTIGYPPHPVTVGTKPRT